MTSLPTIADEHIYHLEQHLLWLLYLKIFPGQTAVLVLEAHTQWHFSAINKVPKMTEQKKRGHGSVKRMLEWTSMACRCHSPLTADFTWR